MRAVVGAPSFSSFWSSHQAWRHPSISQMGSGLMSAGVGGESRLFLRWAKAALSGSPEEYLSYICIPDLLYMYIQTSKSAGTAKHHQTLRAASDGCIRRMPRRAAAGCKVVNAGGTEM